MRLTGDGVPVLVELASTDMQFVDFGVLTINDTISKQVRVINKSKKALEIELEDERERDLEKSFITVDPTRHLSLRPREGAQLEFHFEPKARVMNFKKNLMMRVPGQEPKSLLQLTGACHATEVKIMEEVVQFGNIVKDSS